MGSKNSTLLRSDVAPGSRTSSPATCDNSTASQSADNDRSRSEIHSLHCYPFFTFSALGLLPRGLPLVLFEEPGDSAPLCPRVAAEPPLLGGDIGSSLEPTLPLLGGDSGAFLLGGDIGTSFL